MTADTNKNGWEEWRNHVLRELKENNVHQTSVDKRLSKIEVDLAVLRTEFKLKSGIWGFIAGSVPTVAFILYKAFGG